MLSRLALTFPLLLASVAVASAQGFTPEEATKRMKLPEGFSVRCVAHEPMVKQPVSVSFDNRGRMWVLQYLQYPNYAGLKALKQDQYLRTIWDKVPEPPPHGPKGADKITILSDPDEHGVFAKSKDFVTGLNIASGFCIGNGGVYVAQPPYLLFYQDKNEDDVPDGDPEVLLSGFGMDDTHSLANSLQFGPDGWLYGAAGSTSTCKIKNPNHPKDAVVEFQQGIWRFHPKTKKFELFSEGGGNTYGLDFDKNGQIIAGTNYGGVAALHQMQGAYYVKGFSKHGPLHNPHTYGYFEHIPYAGFKGGHVTCGGIVYQADTYPKEFRDQYIAANLLSNTIDWHKLDPLKSSFKMTRGGELMGTPDTWFRPVDLMQGPDGCVYVVDFYDRRAAHLDPVDNWDKSNGRIYRIEYKDGPNYPSFDLRKKTTAELLELLKHTNVWYRREARQLLVQRLEQERAMIEAKAAGLLFRGSLLQFPFTYGPALWEWADSRKVGYAQAAVLFEEATAIWRLTMEKEGGDFRDVELDLFWTNHALRESNLRELGIPKVIREPSESRRAWEVRLAGDRSERTNISVEKETSPVVLAQIACSTKRMNRYNVLSTLHDLIDNPVCSDDPQIPHLIWWALEPVIGETPLIAKEFTPERHPKAGLYRPLLEKIARRLAAADVHGGDRGLAELIKLWKDEPEPVLRGLQKAVAERKFESVPELLKEPLADLLKSRPNDALVLEILARMGDAKAISAFQDRGADAKRTDAERLNSRDVLKQVRHPLTKALLLTQFMKTKSDALKVGFLAGLEGYDDAAIGEFALEHYASGSPAVKKRSVQLMLSRPAWAIGLFKALDTGKFPKTDVSVDQARIAVALADKDVTSLVEKHFGKIAPATAGEKQARISWLNAQIPREKGADAERGKVLFTKHCAACHVLHGEGGKVGPDLTTADRKNRGYMLAQIVDPSGYIRPEFVVQTILTTDERKVSGIAKEVGETVELSNFVDNKVVVTVVPKKDIADARPSGVSLMPEKILDTMSDPEIADLFAYIVSEGPKKPPEKTPGADTPGSPKDKDKPKLKVALVSGSFEYKSDDSLTLLKRGLEANYPVECVLIAAKAEKDTAFAGIENLAKCDVAIFFTRRLQIEGEALDAVKKFVESKKPIIGIRTASHGFQKWLEMDKDVFGGDYKNHFGPGVADVNIVEKQKEHPILKGVAAFKTNGSLYKNPNVAADVVVLLQGTMGKESEPIAWTREKDGRRVFYTSLGHPDDFKDDNFTRLIVNALAWATKTELKK